MRTKIKLLGKISRMTLDMVKLVLSPGNITLPQDKTLDFSKIN